MGLGFGLGPDVELRSASLLITESGGPEEELPCSTVALVPIEPLAKSSLDRVRCGAPLGLGEDQRRRPKKLCRQAGKSGFQASSSHLRAPERRISWWPGGYGAQKRRGLRSSQHPLRGGGYELKSSPSSTSAHASRSERSRDDPPPIRPPQIADCRRLNLYRIDFAKPPTAKRADIAKRIQLGLHWANRAGENSH